RPTPARNSSTTASRASAVHSFTWRRPVSSPLLPNPFRDDRLTGADVFNPALDVASVHQHASRCLEQAIERARRQDKPDGRAKIAILQSTPGFGKTHVMGRVAHRCRDH